MKKLENLIFAALWIWLFNVLGWISFSMPFYTAIAVSALLISLAYWIWDRIAIPVWIFVGLSVMMLKKPHPVIKSLLIIVITTVVRIAIGTALIFMVGLVAYTVNVNFWLVILMGTVIPFARNQLDK